jgi:hypothetical protein
MALPSTGGSATSTLRLQVSSKRMLAQLTCGTDAPSQCLLTGQAPESCCTLGLLIGKPLSLSMGSDWGCTKEGEHTIACGDLLAYLRQKLLVPDPGERFKAAATVTAVFVVTDMQNLEKTQAAVNRSALGLIGHNNVEYFPRQSSPAHASCIMLLTLCLLLC